MLLQQAPLLPLLLPLEVLALLLGTHIAQGALALLLLHFLELELALLGLLLLVGSAQPPDLFFASVAKLPHHLRSEVGRRDEHVGETEEQAEERHRGGVAGGGGGDLNGQVDALLGSRLLDPGNDVSRSDLNVRMG